MHKPISFSKTGLLFLLSFSITWFIKVLSETAFRGAFDILVAFIFLTVVLCKTLPAFGFRLSQTQDIFPKSFKGRDGGFALIVGIVGGILIFKQSYALESWAILLAILGSIFFFFLSLLVFSEK